MPLIVKPPASGGDRSITAAKPALAGRGRAGDGVPVMTGPPLSPSTRFLLDLVTAHLTKGPLPAITDLDWPEMLVLARHHRLTPFLYGLPDAPAARQAEMKELRGAAVRGALLLAGRLRMITQRFQAAGIDLLVLKGLPQSALLFGNLYARSCRDIDLLVRPAQAAAAVGLLRELGYGAGQEQTNALLLMHQDGGPPVELHTDLAEAGLVFAAADVDPFAHMTQIMLAGQGVPTLSPAATIAYAAWHAGRHRWSRLYWLADLLAAAIQRPAEDWQGALEIARRAGCERHLALAVWLVARLTGITAPLPTAMPPAILPALRRAEAVTMAIWAQAPCSDEAALGRLGTFRLTRAALGLYDGRRALRLLYHRRQGALTRLLGFWQAGPGKAPV